MPEQESAHSEQLDWGERLPHLFQLFAGNLTQSWTSFHDNPAAALQEGIDDQSLPELRTLVAELEELRSQNMADNELHRVLHHDLGTFYHRADGRYSQWLEEVEVQLSEAITLCESEVESSRRLPPSSGLPE